MGVATRRSSLGLSCSSQRRGVSTHSWGKICSVMSQYEKIYKGYIPTDEISRIRRAKTMIGFPSAGEYSCLPTTSSRCSIFASLCFSVKSHSNVHVDNDMCQGLVVVHQPGISYEYCQEPLCYFCFPCLGVAVPLCPGDVIVFNPCEPHCLSSQVRPDNECYAVGMYLKTAIVGLNNNSIPLTPDQEIIYNNINLR